MSSLGSARLVYGTMLGSLFLFLVPSLLSLGLPASLPASPETHTLLSSDALRAPASFDTLHTVSRHVFRHTNRIRRERSLSTLRYDSTLARVACAHNADMMRRDFFRHVNPDGENPHDRVSRIHRRLYGQIGENLFGQSPVRKEGKALATQMMEHWMNSPPHRKNIIRPQFTHLGVCVLQQTDTLRATQVFADVSVYLSSPLPRRVSAGDVISVSIGPTFPSDALPVRYDFWSTEGNRRISTPYVFTDALRFPDTTGTVWSRFYVLEMGRYSVQRGPEVMITSP